MVYFKFVVFFTLCVVWATAFFGLWRYWATAFVGFWAFFWELRRFLAFGVIIRVICVICGLFLICSVFHFVCCLGYGVLWPLALLGYSVCWLLGVFLGATPFFGLWRYYSCNLCNLWFIFNL